MKSSAVSDKPHVSDSESSLRIYEFLREHPTGVIATIDADNNPHASVIYFSIDENFRITFTTKRETKKYDNLVRQNHVMLVAYEASSQTSVQITGYVAKITDDDEANKIFRNTILTSMKTTDGGIPPISRVAAGDYVALQIKPVHIKMASYLKPPHGSGDRFDIIEF